MNNLDIMRFIVERFTSFFLNRVFPSLCYFYFTGISLITRAGLPARTTLSPKDLVITAPAPATTLLPSVTPGRTMTPPPAQKLSPMVMGLPYSTPELRSCGSSGWSGVKN